ncbi:anti-repressor SinI family protein [Gorillibacterium sp. sgz500922]|uniref:anti-repressor SinI family protein n=1 Tax=Gorillibacterium sp. sgz500922 TaxID=3446694 RepID=UPI003F66A1BB
MNGTTERMREWDVEWQELIQTARDMGLSVQEVRLFLACPCPPVLLESAGIEANSV